MEKKGFTLIEILMSALILATVTTGIAYVFFASRKNLLHIHAKIQAAELSKYFLTSLSNEVRQDQWGSNCLGSSAGCGSSATTSPGVQTVDKIPFTPHYTDGCGSGGACISDGMPSEAGVFLAGKKVKLQITWSESSLAD